MCSTMDIYFSTRDVIKNRRGSDDDHFRSQKNAQNFSHPDD